ncbi:MAG TPA: molybdate ABC transporter permease subunit [Aquificaceae bacterium]|nr:molybdate ABC transporter permease subunit [Aquificaceae bacterium]
MTTALLLTISIPMAYALAFREFALKSLIEALVLSPIVLPPTVLGFYLLSLMEMTVQTIAFTFNALVLASVIYSLPFGVFPIKEAFLSVPKRYVEIAYVFGYSPLETFLRVILPNSVGGIIGASALIFSHTMGEFGIVLMVGGNVPGETRTLSIYIYDEVQALNYREAYKASLVLLSASLVSLLLILMVRKRWKRA